MYSVDTELDHRLNNYHCNIYIYILKNVNHFLELFISSSLSYLDLSIQPKLILSSSC